MVSFGHRLPDHPPQNCVLFDDLFQLIQQPLVVSHQLLIVVLFCFFQHRLFPSLFRLVVGDDGFNPDLVLGEVCLVLLGQDGSLEVVVLEGYIFGRGLVDDLFCHSEQVGFHNGYIKSLVCSARSDGFNEAEQEQVQHQKKHYPLRLILELLSNCRISLQLFLLEGLPPLFVWGKLLLHRFCLPLHPYLQLVSIVLYYLFLLPLGSLLLHMIALNLLCLRCFAVVLPERGDHVFLLLNYLAVLAHAVRADRNVDGGFAPVNRLEIVRLGDWTSVRPNLNDDRWDVVWALCAQPIANSHLG